MPAILAFRGMRATARGAAMIAEAERLGGPLRLTQGSYSTSVSASAGTHAREGFDFSVRGLTRTQINRRVAALRRVGFVAWHRLSTEGPWPAHIHAIPVGGDLSPAAGRQVQALRAGRNGLANNALDRHRGLRLPVITFEDYQRQQEDVVTPQDIEAIAEAVWNFDRVPHNRPGARVNSADPTNPDNPTWRAMSVIEESENRLRVIEAKLDKLLAEK